MFSIPLDFKIQSKNSLMKIHFNKINTPCSIKLVGQGGDQVSFSGEQLKDGIKNYILDADSSINLSLQQATQLVFKGN